jgi:hypothetical protein
MMVPLKASRPAKEAVGSAGQMGSQRGVLPARQRQADGGGALPDWSAPSG